MMASVDQLSSSGAQCKMVSPISPSPTSSNAHLRKIKKPLIEKRRRERINECLIQLKALVLEAMNKDGSQYNKMEKADILEMTVAHLKSICGSNARTRSSDTTADVTSQTGKSPSQAAVQRYMSGFTECAIEVANYLSTSNNGETLSATHTHADSVRRGLLEHLDSCLNRQTNCFTSGLTSSISAMSSSTNSAVDSEPAWSLHTVVDNAVLASKTSSPIFRWKTSSSEQRDCMATQLGCLPVQSSTIGVDRLACVADHFTAVAAIASSSPRSRCDSGVYSGASSPTGESGCAVVNDDTSSVSSVSWPVNRDWSAASPRRMSVSPSAGTVQHRCLIADSFDSQEYRRQLQFQQQQQQVLNLTTRAANADVWRPW